MIVTVSSITSVMQLGLLQSCAWANLGCRSYGVHSNVHSNFGRSMIVLGFEIYATR